MRILLRVEFSGALLERGGDVQPFERNAVEARKVELFDVARGRVTDEHEPRADSGLRVEIQESGCCGGSVSGGAEHLPLEHCGKVEARHGRGAEASIGEQPDEVGPPTVDLDPDVEREERDLPLEEALKQFERGIELARTCQSSLKQAEQRVEILLQKDPQAAPDPFETAE